MTYRFPINPWFTPNLGQQAIECGYDEKSVPLGLFGSPQVIHPIIYRLNLANWGLYGTVCLKGFLSSTLIRSFSFKYIICFLLHINWKVERNGCHYIETRIRVILSNCPYKRGAVSSRGHKGTVGASTSPPFPSSAFWQHAFLALYRFHVQGV